MLETNWYQLYLPLLDSYCLGVLDLGSQLRVLLRELPPEFPEFEGTGGSRKAFPDGHGVQGVVGIVAILAGSTLGEELWKGTGEIGGPLEKMPKGPEMIMVGQLTAFSFSWFFKNNKNL